jgi:hypothetical protein
MMSRRIHRKKCSRKSSRRLIWLEQRFPFRLSKAGTNYKKHLRSSASSVGKNTESSRRIRRRRGTKK